MDCVLVTGATRGLGLAICRRLKNDGFRIIGVARSSSPDFEALQSEDPALVFFEKFDLGQTQEIRNFAKKLTTAHGSIYGLVNNAAVGHDGVLATMHETQISELIHINIESPIVLTKYLCRSMMLAQRGRIINISSIIASTGFNGLSVYGATKSALTGFTQSLARELGPVGITVNTVAPGYMETSMSQGLQREKLATIKRRSPLGCLASADDAAAAVSYLMSNDAARITGTVITVDGGSTA